MIPAVLLNKTHLISFKSLVNQEIEFAACVGACFTHNTQHSKTFFHNKKQLEICLYMHLQDNLKSVIYKVRPQSLWGHRCMGRFMSGANFCSHVDLRMPQRYGRGNSHSVWVNISGGIDNLKQLGYDAKINKLSRSHVQQVPRWGWSGLSLSALMYKVIT